MLARLIPCLPLAALSCITALPRALAAGDSPAFADRQFAAPPDVGVAPTFQRDSVGPQLEPADPDRFLERPEAGDESDPLRLTAACRTLGTAARLVFEPLTLGAYEPAQWFSEPWPCATLLVSAGMGIATSIVDKVGHPRRPPVFGAGSFDRFFRDALRSRSGNSVLDSSYSGLLVPAVASGALFLAASSLGGGAGYRDVLTRALPLLAAGASGAGLPTAVFKKSFGRERPYAKFAEPPSSFGDGARESFYSGHATTAFFSAAFADPVLADIVRWRWPTYSLAGDVPWGMRLARVSQAVALYGLAALVGYSRIDSDKHFMTDVLAGAFAGTLQGHLTYRWGYRSATPKPSLELSGIPGGVGLRLSWSF